MPNITTEDAARILAGNTEGASLENLELLISLIENYKNRGSFEERARSGSFSFKTRALRALKQLEEYSEIAKSFVQISNLEECLGKLKKSLHTKNITEEAKKFFEDNKELLEKYGYKDSSLIEHIDFSLIEGKTNKKTEGLAEGFILNQGKTSYLYKKGNLKDILIEIRNSNVFSKDYCPECKLVLMCRNDECGMEVIPYISVGIINKKELHKVESTAVDPSIKEQKKADIIINSPELMVQYTAFLLSYALLGDSKLELRPVHDTNTGNLLISKDEKTIFFIDPARDIEELLHPRTVTGLLENVFDPDKNTYDPKLVFKIDCEKLIAAISILDTRLNLGNLSDHETEMLKGLNVLKNCLEKNKDAFDGIKPTKKDDVSREPITPGRDDKDDEKLKGKLISNPEFFKVLEKYLPKYINISKQESPRQGIGMAR